MSNADPQDKRPNDESEGDNSNDAYQEQADDEAIDDSPSDKLTGDEATGDEANDKHLADKEEKESSHNGDEDDEEHDDDELFAPNIPLPVILATGLVVATFVAYLPASSCGFIRDDGMHVTDNDTLQSIKGLKRIWMELGAVEQYYPLVHTTFWLEYQVWGLNPAGYHLINILLHAANAILLWRILERLKIPGAYVAAALFALHPVHVESVAYISERKNVLSGLFYLIAALLYVRWFFHDEEESENEEQETLTQSSLWLHYGGSIFCFVCALLSKTVTVTLPAALLLVIWWKRGRLQISNVLPLLPMVLVGIPLALNTSAMEQDIIQQNAPGQGHWDFTFVQQFLIAGCAFWFYAFKLLWPVNLTFVYPQWEIDPSNVVLYLGPLGFFAMVGVLFWLRDRIGRGPLTAVLFFAGTLFPALGFVDFYPMRYSLVADHFQYLASIGLIALLAALAWREVEPYIEQNDQAHFFAFAPPLLLLGILTAFQCKIYKSPEALWTHCEKHNPNEIFVLQNLADVSLETGQQIMGTTGNFPHARYYFEQAEDCYNRILKQKPKSEGGKPDPQWTNVLFYKGYVLQLTGRFEEARSIYEDVLQENEKFGDAHWRYGQILQAEQNIEAAIVRYKKAIDVQPGAVGPYLQLAGVYQSQGDIEAAKEHLAKACKLDPHTPEIHISFGQLCQQNHEYDEALKHYLKALSINPENQNLSNLMTELLEQKQQKENLLDIANRDPENTRAHFELSKIFILREQNYEQARYHLDQFLCYAPDNEQASLAYAGVLQNMKKTAMAEEQYRRLLAQKPEFFQAHLNYAVLLRAEDRNEEAIVHFEKAHEIRPSNNQAKNNLDQLKELLEAEKEGKETKEDADKGGENDGDGNNPEDADGKERAQPENGSEKVKDNKTEEKSDEEKGNKGKANEGKASS